MVSYPQIPKDKQVVEANHQQPSDLRDISVCTIGRNWSEKQSDEKAIDLESHLQLGLSSIMKEK